MKKQDFYVLSITIIIVSIFIFNSKLFSIYLNFNMNHGMVTSFMKFGILATFGEMLALRIKNGTYLKKNFGVLPKFIIWGIIGLSIKAAFIIFIAGTTQFVNYLNFEQLTLTNHQPFIQQAVLAFIISIAINIVYAPVMMTFHKITDLHIEKHNGKLLALLKPINFSEILAAIDWKIMWGFVFKKTIPFFWIPMHTITFMLPQEFQVLFAALLSIMLGLILSVATLKSQN